MSLGEWPPNKSATRAFPARGRWRPSRGCVLWGRERCCAGTHAGVAPREAACSASDSLLFRRHAAAKTAPRAALVTPSLLDERGAGRVAFGSPFFASLISTLDSQIGLSGPGFESSPRPALRARVSRRPASFSHRLQAQASRQPPLHSQTFP